MNGIHLLNHFKELKKEFGWDGFLNGSSVVVRFISANRNHIDEFIGLASLIPGIVLKDTSEWLPHDDKDRWSFTAYRSNGPIQPATVSVPQMLKKSFTG